MGLIKRSIFLFAAVCALGATSVLADTVYVPFLDSPPIRETNTYISVGAPSVLVTYNALTKTFTGRGAYTTQGYTNVVTESVTQNGLTGTNQYGTFSFSIHVDAVGAIDDRSSFLMTDLTGATIYWKSSQLLAFGFQQKVANTGRYDFYLKFVQEGPSAMFGVLPGRNFAANILGGTLNYTGPASSLFASSFDTTIGYKADVFGTPLPSAAMGGAGLLLAVGGMPLLRRKRIAASQL